MAKHLPPPKQVKMPGSKPEGSRERVREIAAVLRKHHVVKGVSPKKLRLILEDLGPTFVKFGQIMSMRPDMLPTEYCEELSRLRADVRPMSSEEARGEVERALGEPVGNIFARFDIEPIGSASIAQVHYAELKTGERVVVKIRRPGIRDVMERDVALLHRIPGLLKIIGGTGNAVDFNQVINEIWSAALQEMNFLQEADQAEEFRRRNADVAYVTCPRVYRNYSAESVLVMEYIDGIGIDSPGELRAQGYDPDEIGTKMAENYVKQIVDDGFFHADPHPGNLRVRDGKIVWLDMGLMGRLAQRDRSIFRNAIDAAVRGDVNELCNLLLIFCEPTAPVDRPSLFADVDVLLNRYETLDVGSMNLLDIRNNVVAVAERHGIKMPKGVSILGRSLVTMEGVMGTLCPNINMMQVMVNHLSARAADYFDPQRETQKALTALLQSGKRLPHIPAQVSELLKMGIRGQTKTNVELSSSEKSIRTFNRMADRMAAGCAEGGLLIASSILSVSNLPRGPLGIPTIGAVGFLLSAVLGGWLLWNVLRSRK